MISVRVPTVVPKLAAAPQAASEVVQPRCPDSGCTDLLPPVNECRESLGLYSPDTVESGMEVAGGSPPAEIDISKNLDELLIARSVRTAVSEKSVEVDTPDTVESGCATDSWIRDDGSVRRVVGNCRWNSAAQIFRRTSCPPGEMETIYHWIW